jgi:thioredoxin reductase (NADPH)
MKNVAIIGAGPAGLTSGIYLARANKNPVLLTGDLPGGQLLKTDIIENYPGFESIKGPELMENMLSQATVCGTEIIYESVQNIEKSTGFFKLTLSSGNIISAKSIIIATGASHKHLGIPGETELIKRGVSWCATCDGPIYKSKKVVVICGGNTAITDALFLSNFATDIYLIHRRDSLRADKVMQERLLTKKNILYIWNSEVTEIIGKQNVEAIKVKNRIKGNETSLETDGVFIAIGTIPASKCVQHLVALDENGYIKANETKTSCTGIFAAGDVVSGSLKQAIYAAGLGALASKYAEEYIDAL